MKARTALTIKGNDLIGFKAFVEEKAKAQGITGYASNQPDKSVLVVCEGEQTKISELIISIEKSFFDIKNIQTTHGKATGEFKSFERIENYYAGYPKKESTWNDIYNMLKSIDEKFDKGLKGLRQCSRGNGKTVRATQSDN